MTFVEAIKAVYESKKVVPPEWRGYWFLSNERIGKQFN